jgi:hypothetical protein
MSATPEGGAPAPGTTPPATDGEGRRVSLAAAIAIAVVVLIAAGIGGYAIGHDKGESSGDSKGYSAGVAAGKQQVQANYQPGKPGYQTIYAAGQRAGNAQGQQAGEAQGKKVGFEQGQRQGVTTGDSEGVRQGAAAVLGGFDTWTDGSYYIVTMATGTDAGVPYTVSSRVQIQPGTNYRVCQSGEGDATQLCESPVTASAAADNGGAP